MDNKGVITVRQSVEFSFAGFESVHGFSDADLPIDKIAQVVLSSDVNPITDIAVTYDDGETLEYHVKKVNR